MAKGREHDDVWHEAVKSGQRSAGCGAGWVGLERGSASRSATRGRAVSMLTPPPVETMPEPVTVPVDVASRSVVERRPWFHAASGM